MFTAVTIEITEIHGQRRGFFGRNEGSQLLSLSISRTYKQHETLTVSGFVVVQALLFILRVNILSLGDPV